jgi:hypothetical protein
MEKVPAIGIDLGTTYSCVGVFHHGKVDIIANKEGSRTTPSFVAFTETERLIGESAKIKLTKTPQNTIFGMSKLMHILILKYMSCVARDKVNGLQFIALMLGLTSEMICKASKNCFPLF